MQTAGPRPEGITESEHHAIVTAVDSILTERVRAPEQIEPTVRRRSGLGMVALVNLLALSTLVGSVFLYITFAPRSAPDVNPFSGAVTTAESAILAEVQEQTRRELSEREVQIAQIERELAALRRERQRAPGDPGASDREAELSAALVALQATTAERLQALQGNREQVAFLTGQLTTVYERVREAIRDQAYDRARTHLEDASALLRSAAIADEPTLATVATAIAASNQVIADVIPLAAEESGQLALLSSRFDEIERIVREADARAAADEPDRAASLYRTALGVIDATGHAATRLLEAERAEAARELEERTAPLVARVAELEAELQERTRVAGELRGQINTLTAERDELTRRRAELEAAVADRAAAAEASEREAAASEREAAELARRVATLETEIATLEARSTALRADRERAAAEAAQEIAALRSSIEAAEAQAARAVAAIDRRAARLHAALPDETAPSDAPEVIDLVGTRALLRAVVDAPAIREQYPNLSEDMETYFQALSRERTAAGRAAAFRTASDAIEALAGELGATVSAAPPAGTAAGYLDRLVSLLLETVRSAAR